MGESMLKAPTDPIQIKPEEAGRLIVLVPYAPERVAKIKTIAGRRWDPKERYWTVPHTEAALTDLLALFAGDPVEVDPTLRPVKDLDNRKPPHEPENLHAMTLNSKLLDRERQAIRTRHYSYRTEETYVG